MISISTFLVFACLVLCVFLFNDVASSRKGLYSRISAFAPGARIAERAKTSRRLARLTKPEAMQIDIQLAALAEMLVAVLLAGESLFLALKRISDNSKCVVSDEISKLLKRVELGGDLSVELSALCERVPTEAMREFSNKLSLALGRGTPLAGSLSALAVSIRSSIANRLLRIAGANETKMLIPVVLLICPVTVIFALYPSSQYLAGGFI